MEGQSISRETKVMVHLIVTCEAETWKLRELNRKFCVVEVTVRQKILGLIRKHKHCNVYIWKILNADSDNV